MNLGHVWTIHYSNPSLEPNALALLPSNPPNYEHGTAGTVSKGSSSPHDSAQGHWDAHGDRAHVDPGPYLGTTHLVINNYYHTGIANHSEESPPIDAQDLSTDNMVVFVKRVMTGGDPPLSGPALTLLADIMVKVVASKTLYRHMLSLSGADAQTTLDALQRILDFDFDTLEYALPDGRKGDILKALERLSRRCGLVPESLILQDVESLSDVPHAFGAFGEVFRASSRNRVVALKVFRTYGVSSSDMTKIMAVVGKEAILWAQLRHTNLLPFYGVHSLTGSVERVGLVSPWMKNGDVRDYLSRYPDVNRLLLVSDVASGIAYLHDNNVVHGDLKSPNILISDSGRACLADFGLSRMDDPTILSWTSVRTKATQSGTEAWKAPELFMDEEDLKEMGIEGGISMSSDIYAFACVCYEIMTGCHPWNNLPPHAVYGRVLKGRRPAKPSLEDPAFQRYGLTEAIWRFIEDCWKQTPSERPTASDVLRVPLIASLADSRPEQRWGILSGPGFRYSSIEDSQLNASEPSEVSPAHSFNIILRNPGP